MLLIGCAAAVAINSMGSAAANTSFKASVPINMAAVAAIAERYPGSDGPVLLVSTFGVELFGGLPSFAIPNLPGFLAGNDSVPQQIEGSEKWTNYIGMAPTELGPSVVVTAGGFLVPVGGISTGRVCLFDVSDPANPVATQVSTDKAGWFYHKVVWHDMNLDGRLDLVAARATAPSNPAGELVWFEQPAQGALSNRSATAAPWPVHVVTSGPDVDFLMGDVDGDGRADVVAAQFFSSPVLAMYACPYAAWSLCNESSVVRTVIDDVSGPFFAVELVDLNMDGTADLLATNNQDGKAGDGAGSVFAYERPRSSAANWTKHVLATGFVPQPSLLPSPGAHSRGSPGRATSFHPRTADAGKPHVLLSGDDGGFVAVLSPTSDASASWLYTTHWVANSTGTIGTPAVGDVDGDGFADIFVPFYSENRLEAYSFTETPVPAPSAQCVACLLKKDPVHLSPAYAWCYKDNECHLVGSPGNPCSNAQCASAARASSCGCTSCNNGACHA